MTWPPQCVDHPDPDSPTARHAKAVWKDPLPMVSPFCDWSLTPKDVRHLSKIMQMGRGRGMEGLAWMIYRRMLLRSEARRRLLRDKTKIHCIAELPYTQLIRWMPKFKEK